MTPAMTIGRIAAAGLLALVARPSSASIRERVLELPEVPAVKAIRYGISVPDDIDARRPRPLVLALHPGGELRPGYGAAYLDYFYYARLRVLGAVIVAPDCPKRSWTDEDADKAVMALLQHVLEEFPIDRTRVLVTGYSMGGAGTWFMSSRHADFFTAAVTIAGSPAGQPIETLGRIPTYAIHSRSDEVVPIGPDRETSRQLEKMGRPVRFEAVDGGGHFDTDSYRAAYDRAIRWVEERWRAR